MKFNKVIVTGLVLGSLLALSNICMAQDEKGERKKGPSVQMRLDRMTEELKLTDEQKPKVKAVLEETQKKMQELRDVPREERRDKLTAIRENEDKKLKEILTSDQYSKWEKMREEMRRGGKGGRKKAADDNK